MSAVPPPGTYLPDSWFVVCRADELAGAPRAFTVQQKPLVVFRGPGGAPVAFTDRCPHRNVPLSLGTVVEGTLQCAYHGWRFDGRGACVAVPGLVEGEVSLRSRAVETWACRESDGFVWVYSTPGVEPAVGPFRFPHLDDASYSTVRREFAVEASLHATVENTLDVPHTAYLHGGLFRTAEKRNELEIVVRRGPDRAEAEFLGEPRPQGIIGAVLAPGGGVVQHVDRFFLPSLAQVEYRLGPRGHLVTTSAMTPVHDTLTRVFAVVTFRLPWPVPAWLLAPLAEPVAQAIFAQDARILARQSEVIRRFGGERFTSTELDVLGPQVTRLLKQLAAREPPGPPHEHRVRMRT